MVDFASVILVAVLSSIVYYTSFSIVLEILLSISYLYHILTFSLSYPDSNQLRRLIISFLLSFSDIFLSMLISQKQSPSKLWFWVAEFVVAYVLVLNFTHKEIERGLAGKNLRIFVYAVTGYLKSINLVSLLVFLSQNFKPTEISGFLVLVGVGMVKLSSTIIVYYLDRIVFVGALFDQATLNEVYRRLKLSVLLICLLIEVIAIKSYLSQDFLFDMTLSWPNLVGATFMIIWYLNEAHQYGLKFRKN